MGELHLDIYVERIKREYKVQAFISNYLLYYDIAAGLSLSITIFCRKNIINLNKKILLL